MVKPYSYTLVKVSFENERTVKDVRMKNSTILKLANMAYLENLLRR